MLFYDHVKINQKTSSIRQYTESIIYKNVASEAFLIQSEKQKISCSFSFAERDQN